MCCESLQPNKDLQVSCHTLSSHFRIRSWVRINAIVVAGRLYWKVRVSNGLFCSPNTTAYPCMPYSYIPSSPAQFHAVPCLPIHPFMNHSVLPPNLFPTIRNIPNTSQFPLTTSLTKFLRPILILFETLLTNTRSNINQTGFEILKLYRSNLIHRHMKECLSQRSQWPHCSVLC